MKHGYLEISRIADLLRPYGIEASEDLCIAIRLYISLLDLWNSRVALTTVTDPEKAIRFHFGESLFAVSKMNISKGRLADIGTGPGFPGIPIRMVSPNLELTLIESNQKKTAFLAEVVRTLDLTGVSVLRNRMEDLTGQGKSTFDIVTARAVGQYEDLLKWTGRHLGCGGRVILWLGAEEAARVSANQEWKWQRPVPIPQSHGRFILEGQPH